MSEHEIENETHEHVVTEVPDQARPVDLRGRAVLNLRKKQEFRTHLFVYVVVNGALIVMWAVTGAHLFWPIFPLLGWGIGLIFHAQDVYGRREISEEEIRREMEHLR